MELMQQMEERFAKISEQARRDGVEAELLVEAGESLKLSVSEGKVEKLRCLAITGGRSSRYFGWRRGIFVDREP